VFDKSVYIYLSFKQPNTT